MTLFTMPLKKTLVAFLLFLCFYWGFAQQDATVDSLVNLLETPIADTTKVLVYEELVLMLAYSEPSLAWEYGQKGLKLAEKSGYLLGKGRSLNRIGMLLRANSNYSEALKNYLESLKIAKTTGDKLGEAKVLIGIGILYSEQEDFETSTDYYKQAYALAKELHDDRLQTITLSNIGADYMEGGSLDSALFYNMQAFELASETQSANVDLNLANIGNIYILMGKTDEALPLLKKSIELSKTEDNKRLLSQTYFKLADIYNQMGKTDSALYFAHESINLAEATSNFDYLQKAYSFLADKYAVNRPAEALEYYKKSVAAKDSLYSLDKAAQVRKIAFNEEMRLKEREDAIKAANTKQKMGVLIGLVIGFLVLAGVIYRNYLQKARTNKLLIRQNEDIQTQTTKLEDSLSELKKAQNRLIQAEKLASMGELSAGIAHEIQNPLNFVNNFTEVTMELLEELSEEIADAGLTPEKSAVLNDLLSEINNSQGRILNNGKRASSIVQGMLEHSRTKSGEAREIDINRLCDEYLRLSFHGMRAKDKEFNASFKTEFDPDLPHYYGVTQDLGRVLLNLINNAFYAVNKKRQETDEVGYHPEVTVKTSVSPEELFEIRVIDNGNGMPPEVMEKIFQPFFTTKPSGEGTGLGLSISNEIIVKGNGGIMEVKSSAAAGTEFIVKLPLTVTGPAS